MALDCSKKYITLPEEYCKFWNVYAHDSELLHVYSDVDWAGDRRSNSGYAFIRSGGARARIFHRRTARRRTVRRKENVSFGRLG